MDVSIRPYRESDFDDVIHIWHDGQESTGVRSPDSVANLCERWALQRSGGCEAYIAESAGRAVGFITFQDAEVKQLYVDPARQRQGIGKALLDFAKREMPAGFKLNTAIESRAPKFYEREGLARGHTGIHPRYGHRTIHFTWRPTSS